MSRLMDLIQVQMAQPRLWLRIDARSNFKRANSRQSTWLMILKTVQREMSVVMTVVTWHLQCWFVCLLVSTRTSRQERTAVWPACPATPSARSSLPAWVTDLCVYSTGGWVQMNGKTHTLFIYHPCDLWPHLFLIKENVKVKIITQLLLPSHHSSNTFKNTHKCFCEH